MILLICSLASVVGIVYTLGFDKRSCFWHTNLEMRDQKYLFAYRMIHIMFIYLIRELEPFVKSRATMFVRAPLELRKVIGLVLHWFAHGVNANIIVDRFNVGASTMHKYVDILVDALISRDKFFSWCIFIPHGPHLFRIGLWMDFFHASGLPNVFGAIDGSHILLSQKLNKWVTIILANYYCRWKSCNLIFL